jgi:MFS transporter, DHA1 family, tetracycline resistance protein
MPVAAPSPIPKKALYTLMLINFVDLMGFGLVILLLPFYAERFDASVFQVAALLSVYSACQFVAAPILGTLSDRIGRRPVLMFSQWGSVVGYIVLALPALFHWSPAVGLSVVFLSRIIDGFTAGNITVTNAYVSDVVSSKERAGVMGMLGAAFGLGFALGPPIGGWFSGHVHPAAPGLLAALLSGIASIMVWRFLPESHRTHDRTSATGFAFAPTRLRSVAAQPMVVALSSVWFLCMLAYVMLEPTVPKILIDQYKWSESTAGYFYGCVGVIIIFVQGGLVRPLNKKFGEWPLAFGGAVCGAIGLLLYARVASVAPFFALLAIAALFNALGRSLQTPTLSAMVSQNSDPRAQGAVYGVYQGVASLARVFGPLIGGAIYDRHPPATFMVGGGLLLVAGGVLVAIRPRLRTSHSLEPAIPEPPAKTVADTTGGVVS